MFSKAIEILSLESKVSGVPYSVVSLGLSNKEYADSLQILELIQARNSLKCGATSLQPVLLLNVEWFEQQVPAGRDLPLVKLLISTQRTILSIPAHTLRIWWVFNLSVIKFQALQTTLSGIQQGST